MVRKQHGLYKPKNEINIFYDITTYLLHVANAYNFVLVLIITVSIMFIYKMACILTYVAMYA